MSGVNIIGVQFRRAGKIYDFNAKNLLLAVGDKVVVETERGPSLAEVKRITYADAEGRDLESLKPVVRIALKKDIDAAGRLNSEDAERFARDKIKELNLDMRLIGAEIQFGGNKAILFFSAPGRVDFRELVKELATGLKTRVELKQVGARDEAKQIGGIGICGREFCCSSFLREFVPVSIKMAKNQNLALNPSKVSGGCGRLLCCLTYEDETYTVLRQRLLPKRTRVRLPDGTLGDVVKGDILNQVMLIETDQGEQISVAIDKLEVVERGTGVQDDEWGEDLDLGALMGEDEFPSDDQPTAKPRRQDHGRHSESRRLDARGQQQQPRHAPPSPKKIDASIEEFGDDEDRRHADGRHPDNRHPDNRHPDNRHPDNRHPDNRHPDNRHPDNRHPERSEGSGKRRRNKRRRPRRGGGGGGEGPDGQGPGGAPNG